MAHVDRQGAASVNRATLRTALSMMMMLSGLGLFVFGSTWAPAVLELLPDTPAGFWLELVVPFLPMVFVGGGAMLLVGSRK